MGRPTAFVFYLGFSNVGCNKEREREREREREGEGEGQREKGGAGRGREREGGRVGERAGEGEGDTQLHEKFSQPQRQRVRLAQESVLVPAPSPVMTHHLYTSSFIKHDKQSLLAISFARVASSYPPSSLPLLSSY